MSLFRLFTHQVRDLARAVFMPFKAIFVVGLCALVNAMSYHGHWWFKWVAFGMAIAVFVAFARVAKTLVLLGLVAWAGWWVHRRYGAAARARFDEWATRSGPQVQQLVDRVRGTATA